MRFHLRNEGRDAILTFSGEPEEVRRMFDLLVETFEYEHKRMIAELPTQSEVKKRVGGCGCPDGPMKP